MTDLMLYVIAIGGALGCLVVLLLMICVWKFVNGVYRIAEAIERVADVQAESTRAAIRQTPATRRAAGDR